MGTRYYDPALGRFTQPDPAESGAANLYHYANQDPVNFVDPNGEDPWGRDCATGKDYCGPREIGVVEVCSNRCVIVGVITLVGPTKAYKAFKAAGRMKGVAEAISRSVFNNNRYVRIGYGKHGGRRIFRLAVGGKNATVKVGKKLIKLPHWHWP